MGAVLMGTPPRGALVPAVVVMAKAPVAGRSKTRLCPPCRPVDAARLAEASLRDTLLAVRATPGVRAVLALDGAVGTWCPPGVEVVDQPAGDLGHRLGAVIEHVGGPLLVIGMDTPQVGPTLLADLAGRIGPGRAVLGPAADGGWWALGLHRGDGRAVRGVPMSRDDTFDRQVERLRSLGLEVEVAPRRRDVDHWDDALAVAAEVPGSGFAAAVAEVAASLAGTASLTGTGDR